ncbi:ABC transporter substrate-binding protein [Acidithiobacillus thiooxidans]|uniref:ABC transporter substrate-binding protein n=1 Tax=Acidithiobacillus thiooxidans TaxID=930 RepID=UPI001C079FD7|nr:ABC transporter substrate-binding protein [Acidithiobacillus thiooxidans]MBU2749652.1 ABC transporter substrate-binding protein [Acidithiobacillus thiooxidans]
MITFSFYNISKFYIIRAIIFLMILMPVLAYSKPIVFSTNWYAEAEAGGYYQAVATGIYKKFGLNVKVVQGNADINGQQLLVAGKYQFYMGSAVNNIVAISHGLPIVTVAAIFQQSPTCIYTHEDITSLNRLNSPKYKILVSANEVNTWWPWAMHKFGFNPNQRGVYTGSVAPFIADKNTAQQGFAGSEGYAIRKAGVKFHTFILANYGYPDYTLTIETTDAMVKHHPEIVKKFVEATLLGYKSYLENPKPGNRLIKEVNPKQSDGRLAYGLDAMINDKELIGKSANSYGIGIMTNSRWKKIDQIAVENGLVKKSVDYKKAYTLNFICNIHVFVNKHG